jgi:hypothetical protein
MNKSWSSNFSYGFYKEILEIINEKYEQHLFRDIPNFISKDWGTYKIVLRHDIDLDLEKALEMAKMEFKHGIKATYMVMVNCPFYSLEDTQSKKILDNITEMGHEIALHFDSKRDINLYESTKENDLMTNLEFAISKLEQAISSKVFSISFHRPAPEIINGPLLVNKRINAYAKELMGWYLSDSKGSWREGNPVPKIKKPKKKLLQLLVHPFWWEEKHESAFDRLQDFFDSKIKNLDSKSINEFDELLSNHLTIQRKGKLNIN